MSSITLDVVFNNHNLLMKKKKSTLVGRVQNSYPYGHESIFFMGNPFFIFYLFFHWITDTHI